MLGDRRPAGAEIPGDLANAVAAAAEHSKNLAARGISDRSKDCCALAAVHCNHRVTHMVTRWLQMSSGARKYPNGCSLKSREFSIVLPGRRTADRICCAGG